MDLTFLGATKTVTGSKYHLKVESGNILIDCGLFQGHKELRMRNWAKLPLDPRALSAVVLTHAHLDHSGYLPLLAKNGFKGKIYCSKGTKDLCSILLPDSGFIQEEDARRANRYGYSKHKPALPLYTQQDALAVLEQFHPLEFSKTYQLLEGLTVELLPAGHIIGASLLRFEAEGKTLVFTGDLGRPHDPLMNPPTFISSADYLVTESTYGDRLHSDEDPKEQLAAIINKTIARGGTVLIPAFAVGRTQDVLFHLYQLKKEGRISDIPIFLDSPMAQDASDLLKNYAGEHRISETLSAAICKQAKYVNTSDESKELDQLTMPVIIISASGMMEGGRILHHMKAFLPNHRNCLILTGYQAGGTRGDRLLRKERELKIHGESVAVRAEIAVMNNMSAHADYRELLDWLKHFKQPPRRVFITHGENESALALEEKIKEELGWSCVVPEYLQTEKL